MMLCLHLNLSSSQALVSKHVALPIICPLPSDYKVGFGGKFGVQTDRQDKSAAGWDHIEKVEKHESQTDHKKGFGGKYGVGVQDKSAVGWEHHEKVDKHESQKGPPLSVQSFCHVLVYPCQITSPVSEESLASRTTEWTRALWVGNITRRSISTNLKKVSFAYSRFRFVPIYFSHLFCFLCMSLLFLSAQDYKTGFGGQFGVQNDRVDASAAGWDHVEKVPKHPSQQGRTYA